MDRWNAWDRQMGAWIDTERGRTDRQGQGQLCGHTEGQKGCLEGEKHRQRDTDEQVGHKDGQMDRYMRHMDRQTGIQTDRCTDEMDNIQLGAQRGERNS